MTDPCFRHPESPSVHRCGNCFKYVCQACLRFAGARELCPDCHGLVTRSGWARNGVLALALGGVAVGIGAFAYYASQQPPPAPKVPSAQTAPRPVSIGEQWRARLEKEPCDRRLALKASRELLKDNEPRETIGVVDRYMASCPPVPRLLWDKYAAHERLGEFELAAETAGRLIESNPDDPDFWYWRGKAQAAQDRHEEAERDFVQALVILPQARNIPFDLASTYEKLQRPCDALRALEDHRGHHPYQGSYPMLEARLERLERIGGCGSLQGQGKPVVLRFPPKAATIHARVKFNGDTEGLFIVDTGASQVFLSRRFANRLGIPEGERKHWALTANGKTKFQLATVKEVDLRGARARGVQVGILEDLGDPKVDGLLGMNFLARFEMKVSPDKGTLELIPRSAPAHQAGGEVIETVHGLGYRLAIP